MQTAAAMRPTEARAIRYHPTAGMVQTRWTGLRSWPAARWFEAVRTHRPHLVLLFDGENWHAHGPTQWVSAYLTTYRQPELVDAEAK